MTDWVAAPADAEVVPGVTSRFREVFGASPDGVWAAPGRVNLMGEHTDYNAGLCLPSALPHRTYAAVRLRSDDQVRLASAQSPENWAGRLEQVGPGHPAGWAGYVAGVLWALHQAGCEVAGVEVVVDGRVPLGAGMSSSAALSCSVAVALAELVPQVGALGLQRLAQVCVVAENEVVGAATGGLDQVAALRSRAGTVLALDCADFSVEHLPWTLPDAELLVIDTRAPHRLADGQYAERRHTCERAAAHLGMRTLREVSDLDAALRQLADPVQRDRVRHVVTEIDRVRQAVLAVREARAADLGALMTASHASLRDDYEVSCPELDLAVAAALDAGAWGARMTGGGFGGSAVALVPAGAAGVVGGAVTAAYQAAGYGAPGLLRAPPSGPAGRAC